MSAFRVIFIQFLDVLYRIIVDLCFARQDAPQQKLSNKFAAFVFGFRCLCFTKIGCVCRGQFQYWDSDFA